MKPADYASGLAVAESAAAGERSGLPPPVARIVEALLFAGGGPLSDEKVCGIIRGLTPEGFHSAIDELARQYRWQARPYGVEQRRGGFVLALKPSFAALKARLAGGPRQTRLSVPALDVLAVVAYKQPIARGEIDTLRGHDSAAHLRQLVRLGLIAMDGPGFGTTHRFLELFGLKSLDDLPQTADLQRI